MTLQDFMTDPHVIGFVNWAVNHFLGITVNLSISPRGTGRADRQVGPGVVGQYQGMDSVTKAYHWRAEWTDANGQPIPSANWISTRQSLALLSDWISNEVNAGAQQGTLDACTAILRWGGDRNPDVGAQAFLQGIADLPGYLQDCQGQFNLATADTDQLDHVSEMNSMLTKIHALTSTDGLPIYDSRVAAAISSLVEIYRQALPQPWHALPEALHFKAILIIPPIGIKWTFLR